MDKNVKILCKISVKLGSRSYICLYLKTYTFRTIVILEEESPEKQNVVLSLGNGLEKEIPVIICG